eukprot:scaffold66122_cov69-Phaeocystis_antarctica.AAC.3
MCTSSSSVAPCTRCRVHISPTELGCGAQVGVAGAAAHMHSHSVRRNDGELHARDLLLPELCKLGFGCGSEGGFGSGSGLGSVVRVTSSGSRVGVGVRPAARAGAVVRIRARARVGIAHLAWFAGYQVDLDGCFGRVRRPLDRPHHHPGHCTCPFGQLDRHDDAQRAVGEVFVLQPLVVREHDALADVQQDCAWIARQQRIYARPSRRTRDLAVLALADAVVDGVAPVDVVLACGRGRVLGGADHPPPARAVARRSTGRRRVGRAAGALLQVGAVDLVHLGAARGEHAAERTDGAVAEVLRHFHLARTAPVGCAHALDVAKVHSVSRRAVLRA